MVKSSTYLLTVPTTRLRILFTIVADANAAVVLAVTSTYSHIYGFTVFLNCSLLLRLFIRQLDFTIVV